MAQTANPDPVSLSEKQSEHTALLSLRRSWWRWVGIYLLVLLLSGWGMVIVGHLKLASALSFSALSGWIGLGLLTGSIELAILGRSLDKNRWPQEGALRSELGWANRLTLLRGVCYVVMSGFLFGPQPTGWVAWLPALLYTAASIADLFDGYIARRNDETSLLGQILDMEFDGLGILIVTLLAIHLNQLPWIYLLVAVSRPLFVLGMVLRQRMGKVNHPMHPSSNRRLVAGVHMGFMTVVLWPIVQPPATFLAAALFGGALMLSFARDWLVVAGWISPDSVNYQTVRERTKILFFRYLPLPLRCVILLLGIRLFAEIAGLGLTSPQVFAVIGLLFLGILGVTGSVLGIAPRLSGIVLIGFSCGHLLLFDTSWGNLSLLVMGGLLLLWGSGPWSLWRGEERFFAEPLGSEG